MQVPAPFEYERATSVEHAIGLLERLGSSARLVAGGWLPGTLVEQVSRSVVKLLNLEAGDEAPSGPVGFSSPSVGDAVTAGGEGAGQSTAGREAVGQSARGEFGPAPVMPAAAPFSGPSVSAPAVPVSAVPAPGVSVPEPRDAPPAEQRPGRLTVSVAAASAPGDGGRGRRLSCTVALAVAGALAAVTVGSVFLFDLLPGRGENDAGGSSNGAYSPPPGATSSASSTDGSTAADGAGVPAGYLGTWEGQGLVLDGALPAGTFRVTVHQAGVGEEVGRVRQTDQLGGVCNDVLTLKKVTKKELVTTSVGARSNHAGCNPTAHTVRLQRVGDDLTYVSDSEAEGKPTARMSKVK